MSVFSAYGCFFNFFLSYLPQELLILFKKIFFQHLVSLIVLFVQSIAECEAKYGKENKKPKASNSKTGTSGKEKKCNVSKEEDGKGKYV